MPAELVNATSWFTSDERMVRLDSELSNFGNAGRLLLDALAFAEDVIFPEATWAGYGMGWMIGQYRGRRLMEHGGGTDGSLTECMLLPRDGLGVLVLTNSSSGCMGRVIALRLLDELLEMVPIDWRGRFKERQAVNIAGAREARAARPRVEGAELPRPAAEYAGEYEHPGYGTLSITEQDGRLVPRFGTMKLALTHRHFDVFDLEWWEWAEDFQIFPLTFLTAPEGAVMALTVPFESAVEPIRFERRFFEKSTMIHSEKIHFELIRLVSGERLMRITEPESGLALEKRLDPNLPVIRQKQRLIEAFEAAQAKAESSAA